MWSDRKGCRGGAEPSATELSRDFGPPWTGRNLPTGCNFSDQTLRTASEGGTPKCSVRFNRLLRPNRCSTIKRGRGACGRETPGNPAAPRCNARFPGRGAKRPPTPAPAACHVPRASGTPSCTGFRARRDRSALRRTPSPHVPAQISWAAARVRFRQLMGRNGVTEDPSDGSRRPPSWTTPHRSGHDPKRRRRAVRSC